MKKKVAIVFGGNSVEHEISILSAIQASHAIDRNKYDLLNVYITKDSEFWVGPKFNELQTFRKQKFKHYNVGFYKHKGRMFLKGIRCFLPHRYRGNIYAIIPVVHGNNVEDGSLAGYFNILNVPYASSTVFTAALLQNKFATKLFLNECLLQVVPYFHFYIKQYKTDAFSVIEKTEELGYPVIIKPVSLGSSIGIKIADDKNELIKALNYAIKYDDEIIIEKRLTDFKELNQAILKQEHDYIYSNIEEVKASSAFLTFGDKYMPKLSERVIPAEISEELKADINAYSRKIAEVFRPGGVIRIDYLYCNTTKKLFVNEINSIPGSLSFYLFDGIISFPDMIETLISGAALNKYYKGLKLTSFKTNVLHSDRHLKK